MKTKTTKTARKLLEKVKKTAPKLAKTKKPLVEPETSLTPKAPRKGVERIIHGAASLVASAAMPPETPVPVA